MLLKLLLVAGGVTAAILVLRWFLTRPPAAIRRGLGRWGLVGLVGVLLLLVATGRLHALIAVAGAALGAVMRLLPLLRFLPVARQVAGAVKGGASADGRSRVRARLVEMWLDQGSGAMGGTVLEGPESGRTLESMALEELIDLHARWQSQDPDSARLLAAYLQNVHDHVCDDAAGTEGPESAANGGAGAMTAAEARAILDLPEDADRDAIVAAHRRLMQKLHPDRGGSDYLAAKINEAKDVLLKARA